MIKCLHQNVGQPHYIMIANKLLQNMAELKHLETQCQVRITFNTKLRSDKIQVMFAVIQIRIFYLTA